MDVVKAEMDKALLEAAGIPAFIADKNSAAFRLRHDPRAESTLSGEFNGRRE